MKRRRSKAGWIVFLLFAGLGLFLAGFGAREWVLQRRALAAAEEVQATITKSEVHTSRSTDTTRTSSRDRSTTTHRPEVAFEYSFRGTRYTSDQLGPTAIVTGHSSPEAAAELLRPYPVGARVTAYVDPARPERGFLDKSPSIGPTVFVAIGLLVAVVAWFVSRFV